MPPLISRPVVVLLVPLVLIAGVSPLAAQQAKIEHIGAFGPNPGGSFGKAVTDQGVVAGYANEYGEHTRPFRWTSAEGIQELASGLEGRALCISADGNVIGGHLGGSNLLASRWTSNGGTVELDPGPAFASLWWAAGISADGSVIVGRGTQTNGILGPFRWTSAGTQYLGSLGSFRHSEATAVSPDGSVVVGFSGMYWEEKTGRPTVDRAFRWTEAGGMENLGYIDDGLNGFPGHYQSYARALSADGSVVVGEYWLPGDKRGAFVHTAQGGMQPLPKENAGDRSYATGVSADGRVIVGYFIPVGQSTEACVWIDGTFRRLRDVLESDYAIDLSEWPKLMAVAGCSPDGTRFTGQGKFGLDRAFCVTLRADFQPPTLESAVDEGETFEVKVGQSFSATFLGTDPDGEGLTLTATGLPQGATLTPASGTTSTSPIDAELTWTPGPGDFGASHEVTITFDDGYANGKVSRTFTIDVPTNDAPTVLPIAPKTVECVDGQHLVTLSTTIDDANGDPLNVTWRVNGDVAKTETGVAAGTEISFEHDYPHGVHAVQLIVSDGYESATVGTTVTVQDTTDPIVVVAGDVVVPTDAGEDFATGVVLPEPDVSDASGHDVTLTSDAPEVYPLGETIVTWTAEDEAGNEATATQKVTVEDREAPTIEGIASVQFFVDPGTVVSTQRPPLPLVSDNVDAPEEIAIASDAPAAFPIGATTVTFTATDGAGNSSEWTTEVVVVNRRPKANAGADLVVETTHERGLRLSLDGSASSDPDSHPLTYYWSAEGLKFAGKHSTTPSAMFPVGRTFATLAVTDSAGASDTDRVRIVVKLKNGKPRPRGAQANEAFAAAAEQAATSSNPAASSGLLYASAAAALGDAAGEFVRWEEGGSEADALLAYSELRALQRIYGSAAANELLAGYAETGDESLLAAALSATSGSAYAGADLSEP